MIYIFVLSFILLWMSCESGVRISGGRDALRDEFPYVVRVDLKTAESPEDTIYNYFQFCTGAVLTTKWVLSAAHCANAYGYDKTKMFVRYNSYFPDNSGLLAPFLETIVHPGYLYHGLVSMKFDILLIRSADIIVSQYCKVNSVDFKSLVGHAAVSLGFGKTNTNSFNKPLHILTGMLSSCPEKQMNTSQMICLVRQCTVKATICGGDSGEPVMHRAGIVGINSLGNDDCNEHTKVFRLTACTSATMLSPISPVLDWIRNYCK